MTTNNTGLITFDDGATLQLASAWVACEYLALMVDIDSLDDDSHLSATPIVNTDDTATRIIA